MQEPSHPPIGLYVHVPFCASKCAYCDFTSYAGREADVPQYVDALVGEIARRGKEVGHPAANTVFLGGGTPSLLDERQATRILQALFDAFPMVPDTEITCECNPGTLGTHGRPHPQPLSQRERGDSFAAALRKAGVNRLSLGAQAKQPHLLQMLGRIHTWEEVAASVEIARRAGFENINLDLMFGLPAGKGVRNLLPERPEGCFAQKVPDTFSDKKKVPDTFFAETLAAAVALAPEHISCYSLMVEEGTPICRDIAEGKLVLPDEDTDRAMYELARQTLAAHGYLQYEISNFARRGFECRHNIGCWTRVPYLGFGCAAHSFFNECRTMNPATLDAYLAGEPPKTERISRETARFESLMLGLRMTRGVGDEDFSRMHGLSIREAFGAKLDKPLGEGLLEWSEGALRLTRRGMDLENTVLVDLL